MTWIVLAVGGVLLAGAFAAAWPALHKKLGTRLGDGRVTFRDMLKMSSVELDQAVERAVQLHNNTAASWAAFDCRSRSRGIMRMVQSMSVCARIRA